MAFIIFMLAVFAAVYFAEEMRKLEKRIKELEERREYERMAKKDTRG